MSEYNSNYEIAQAISQRIGVEPIPFDSVYEICLQIYNELGGEPAEFDSVYEILLGILPLVEGGGSGKAIEEVDALPEASENKEKFYRLSSDDNVYVSELKSRTTTTTNRLPDAQQIGKGYLIDANPEVYKYEGDWTIVCTDGNVTLKCWNYDIEDDRAFFTVDNAETITSSSKIIIVSLLNWTDVDLEDKSLNVDNTKSEVLELIENGDTLPAFELIPIPATYNAPEANQIGNAYFVVAGELMFYTGEEITLVVSDGQISGLYQWLREGDDGSDYAGYLTKQRASDIYCNINHVEEIMISDTEVTCDVEPTQGWTKSGNTWTNMNLTLSDIEFYSLADYNEVEIDKVYIPQLNAPDSEQVDNAYIDYDGITFTYKYKGQYSIVCDNGSFNAYCWYTYDEGDHYNMFIYSTVDAEHFYGLSNSQTLPYLSDEEMALSVDFGNKTITVDGLNIEDLSEYTLPTEYMSLSTVKYQRTEVTEVWDWQPLTDNATNDDIDLMFTNEIKLIRYQDAEQQAEGFVDWWVNTEGETMEYNGQTYYKWVAWYNSEDNVSPTEHTYYVMLTNTLDVTLPFNTDSSEYEYTIIYDSEEGTWGDGRYFHGDYTQKIVQ